MTPAEKAIQLSDKTPFQEDVSNDYVIENERIKVSNYQADLKLRKFKG